MGDVALYLAALAAGHVGAAPMFAALAFIALFGAAVTAFDASYLMYARYYSLQLERYINNRLGAQILVGARLEDSYLFLLNERKLVTVATGYVP